MYRLMLFSSLCSLLFFSCGSHHSSRVPGLGGIEGEEVGQKSIQERVVSAISKNDQAEFGKILEEGFSINSRLENGRTALMESVIWNRRVLVKFLLDRGADTLLKDEDNKTALDHAEEKPNVLQVLKPELMRKWEADFFISLESDNYNESNRLLKDYYVNPNIFSVEGETPLTLCIKQNKRSIRALLQTRSQDHLTLDVNLKNKMKESPISLARAMGRVDIIKVLLKSGAKEE